MSDTKRNLPRNDLRFQWGDPPKPNIWRAEQEVGYFGKTSFLEVRSPLIKGYIRIVEDEKRKLGCVGYVESDNAKPIPLEPEGRSLIPLSEITSHEFYKAYVEPKIFDGRIKLTHGSSKVASMDIAPNLKPRWGNPPKRNVWKVWVDRSDLDLGGGQAVVESPLLEGEDASFYLRWLEGLDKWSIEYSPSMEWGDDYQRIGTFSAPDFEKALSIFLSEKGWDMIGRWLAIRSSRGGKQVFKTRVASSDGLKAMWGDPPKPNMWKVKTGTYHNKKRRPKGMEWVEVTSPNLYGGDMSNITLTHGPMDTWDVSFNPYSEEHHVHRFGADTFEEARDRFLSQEGWSWIKDWMKTKGDIFNTKVASSDGLKAMWGNPPKRNLWKVSVTKISEKDGQAWVTSPVLLPHTSISLSKFRDRWYIVFEGDDGDPYEDLHSFYARVNFDEALDFFLSEKGWAQIKSALDNFSIEAFNTKVASDSGSYTVQWGDPPKPNMWKTKIVYSPNPEKADQPIGLIISSAFDKSVFSIGRWQGTWELSYQSRYGREVLSRHRTKDDFQSAVDFYLSPKGWKLVKLFKKRYPEKMTDEWKSMKIATSWLEDGATDIKLQWGDPPKPNMWKVIENKLLQFTGRGEEGYAVHSPAMVGSIFLTFKQGSYSKLEYMERGGEVVTLKLLDKHSLKHSVELMAHPALWKNVIKPAIQSGKINLTVPKVASIASPNKKKIELKWGTPAKPNVWKVNVNDYGNWAITSPLMVGVIVYYTETGAVIYHGAPGKADVKLHAFDINAPQHKIEHLLKSTAFWRKIEPHIHLRRKVASSEGLKAQWGTPAKPNVWDVDENEAYHQVLVSSPLMDGKKIECFAMRQMKKGEYVIELVLPTHDVVIKEFKAPTYEVARTYFLSNECWQRTLKSYAHKPYFKTKVASSDGLKAMWGNPPKPNIWDVRHNNTLKTLFVSSPLMSKKNYPYFYFGLTHKDDNTYHIQLILPNKDVVLKELKAPTYEEACAYFLSNECWQKNLKPYANLRFFKTKVASASKVAYLYRKGQGFPSSVNTHLINLLAQPQRGSRQKPKDPADFKLSIRGLTVHNDEWCLEFNYSYKGAKDVRGGVFLERLDSKYDGGQGSPTKQEVIDACLKATRGMMTFDYYR